MTTLRVFSKGLSHEAGSFIARARPGEPVVAAVFGATSVLPRRICTAATWLSLSPAGPAGTAVIPERLMDNWWLKAQGVRYPDEPV
jgi:hypothetical protein